jgi:hypothetical protein
MVIAIIGGTGLIGTALAEQLVRTGHTVIVLSRNPGRAANIPDGAELRKWFGSEPAANVPVMEDSDAAVNLAGASIMRRWTSSNKEKIRLSRVRTGRILTESISLAEKKPKLLVQGSAFGYYGPGEETADERSGPGDDFLARVCVEWEDSTRAVEDMGVRRVIIRTGIVLSNAGGAFPLMKLPFRFFAGGVLGSGKQILSWIDLEDEAAAIRFLIESEKAAGTFNLTSPEPVTNKRFSCLLGKAMGRPSFLRIPGLLIRLVMGEMSSVILKGRAVHPSRLKEMGFDFRFPGISKALDNLLKED